MKRFKELWEKGLKSEEIARELRISEELVPMYAVAANLLPERLLKRGKTRKVTAQVLVYMRDMFLDGASIEEIADFFEIDRGTARKYLKEIGLVRGKKRARKKITREELEELVRKGYSDRKIAEYFGVTVGYIASLRHKYGIYKKGPRGSHHRKHLEKIADTIMSEIDEKCYVTRRELQEKGVNIDSRMLHELEDFIEGFQWFRITQTSTPHYTVFPPTLNGLIVMYVEGCEKEVAEYLLSQSRPVPGRILKILLKNWGAPEKLREALNRLLLYYGEGDERVLLTSLEAITFVERIRETLGTEPRRFLRCEEGCRGEEWDCCWLEVDVEWSGKVPDDVYVRFTDKNGNRLEVARIIHLGEKLYRVVLQIRVPVLR